MLRCLFFFVSCLLHVLSYLRTFLAGAGKNYGRRKKKKRRIREGRRGESRRRRKEDESKFSFTSVTGGHASLGPVRILLLDLSWLALLCLVITSLYHHHGHCCFFSMFLLLLLLLLLLIIIISFSLLLPQLASILLLFVSSSCTQSCPACSFVLQSTQSHSVTRFDNACSLFCLFLCNQFRAIHPPSPLEPIFVDRIPSDDPFVPIRFPSSATAFYFASKGALISDPNHLPLIPSPPQSSAHHLAIIVPFRDSSTRSSQGQNRTANLLEFLPAMNRFLDRVGRKDHYHIFIVEQSEGYVFNKGALFNIGYLVAKHNYDYLCLHDVDQVSFCAVCCI